jgi:hypothetical protein
MKNVLYVALFALSFYANAQEMKNFSDPFDVTCKDSKCTHAHQAYEVRFNCDNRAIVLGTARTSHGTGLPEIELLTFYFQNYNKCANTQKAMMESNPLPMYLKLDNFNKTVLVVERKVKKASKPKIEEAPIICPGGDCRVD